MGGAGRASKALLLARLSLVGRGAWTGLASVLKLKSSLVSSLLIFLPLPSLPQLFIFMCFFFLVIMTIAIHFFRCLLYFLTT